LVFIASPPPAHTAHPPPPAAPRPNHYVLSPVKTKPSVKMSVIAQGAVADFTAPKLLDMRQVVATAANVSVNEVTIVITPGVYNGSSPEAKEFLEELSLSAEKDTMELSTKTLEAIVQITTTPTSGVPVVVVTVTITLKTKQAALSTSTVLQGKTNTTQKATDFFALVAGGVTVHSTPTILTIPDPKEDETVDQIGSIDPSGWAILPGTSRLIPLWQFRRWEKIKSIWANTIHKHKEVPVHDVDSSTLPCLLANGEWGTMSLVAYRATVGHDTVPLMREAPVNCDGTIHQKNDGKPMRRHAIADPTILPKADSYGKAHHQKTHLARATELSSAKGIMDTH